MKVTLTWCPKCRKQGDSCRALCQECGALLEDMLFDVYPVPSEVQTKSEVTVIRNNDEEIFSLVVFDLLPEPGRVWLKQPQKDIISMSCEEFENDYRFYYPIYGEQFSTHNE